MIRFLYSKKGKIFMSELENTVQTEITLSGVEEALLLDGAIIEYPDQDPDVLPEGIGDSNGLRSTAPSYVNPYYIHTDGGGYNRCIKISGNSCIPNCVGYAYGALLEEAGIKADARIPRCNAEDWLIMAKANGMKTGTTPKLGAVICWRQGSHWNGNDGCGHVGIVVAIYADGSILVAQSNYGGTRFFTTLLKPPYSIYGQQLEGFIYNDKFVSSVTPAPKNNGLGAAKSFSASLAGAYVTTAGVNIRKGPSTDYASYAVLPKGTKVQCYGYYTAAGSYKWMYVIATYNGKSITGHVYSQYLTAAAVVKTVKVGSRIRIRNGAMQYGKRVGFAAKVYNTIYTVSEIYGDRVVFNAGRVVMGAVRKSDCIVQ